MGDPKTEDTTRRRNDSILWPNGTDTFIGPYESVCDENQNKLKESRAMDSGAVKQDVMSNHPEEKLENSNTRFSLDGSESAHFSRMPGPSPSLLAALQSLGEHSDHMLFPHSLHQIAEAYFLEEDYLWAVQFLHLERLYHERLLSNLVSLQEEWESQWKAGAQGKSSSPMKSHCRDTESKRMDSLSHICRTHQRPIWTKEKDMVDLTLKNSSREFTEEGDMVQKTTSVDPEEREKWKEESQTEPEEEESEEDEIFEDEGSIEEFHEEVVRGGRVSGKEPTNLIRLEATFPCNGPVSILKKRGCLEGTDPADSFPIKSSYKRKVHFSETDETIDNDEVGGASCFMFLLLCLITVLISMGGTVLYCVLGGALSNICTDFFHDMEFYLGPVRWSVETLIRWFTSRS